MSEPNYTQVNEFIDTKIRKRIEEQIAQDDKSNDNIVLYLILNTLSEISYGDAKIETKEELIEEFNSEIQDIAIFSGQNYVSDDLNNIGFCYVLNTIVDFYGNEFPFKKDGKPHFEVYEIARCFSEISLQGMLEHFEANNIFDEIDFDDEDNELGYKKEDLNYIGKFLACLDHDFSSDYLNYVLDYIDEHILGHKIPLAAKFSSVKLR